MIEIIFWIGQPRIAWWWKIQPWWWLGNQEGLDPNYMPQWPLWQRRVFWFFRNFAYNFFRFVVGVEDRSFYVTGDAPVFTTFWYECAVPRFGYKHSSIDLDWIKLPFVSYSGNRVVWYAGWLPSGGRLGLKFNLVSHG